MHTTDNEAIIGIVGGVGPYAGADLLRKIFDQTLASTDQAHLSVALLSYPGGIADRTAFLLGESEINPANALYDVIVDLARLGAVGIGIPCNSAHAPPVYDKIKALLHQSDIKVELLNMIEETIAYIRGELPDVKNVGVLSTLGTARAGTYSTALKQAGLRPIVPEESMQQQLHRTIYSIKAHANPALAQDRQAALQAVRHLIGAGADAVILGCTELPLAVSSQTIDHVAIIDPTLILARALIRRVNPDRLKAMSIDYSEGPITKG